MPSSPRGVTPLQPGSAAAASPNSRSRSSRKSTSNSNSNSSSNSSSGGDKDQLQANTSRPHTPERRAEVEAPHEQRADTAIPAAPSSAARPDLGGATPTVAVESIASPPPRQPAFQLEPMADTSHLYSHSTRPPGQVHFQPGLRPTRGGLSASPSPTPSPFTPTPVPYHLLRDLSGMGAAELANAIIHLYRGEMSRQIAYRVRLDTCTNWAVTITAAMTVFSLGNQNIPHYFHAIIGAFIVIFLILEGRRYGYYIAIKSRVRQLECGFFGRVLMGDEFGRSMCGLIPSEHPNADFEDDTFVLPRPSPPQFVSPFVKTRKIVADPAPAAVDGAPPMSGQGDPSALAAAVSVQTGHSMDEQEALSYYQSQATKAATARFSGNRQHSMSSTSSATSSTGSHVSSASLQPIIQPHLNDWTHLLYHSLLYPEINISLFDSILIRLRRVYMLLFLGVLASWIIKVHLEVKLSVGLHIVMVLAVCAVYLIIAFIVWFYLPQQRSRMHAEKHVAAMFIQKRQRQVSDGQDKEREKLSWWKRRHNYGTLRHSDSAEGLRRRTAPEAAVAEAVVASPASGQPAAYHQSTPLAPPAAQHSKFPHVASMEELQYWAQHSTRCNLEYDADV